MEIAAEATPRKQAAQGQTATAATTDHSGSERQWEATRGAERGEPCVTDSEAARV